MLEQIMPSQQNNLGIMQLAQLAQAEQGQELSRQKFAELQAENKFRQEMEMEELFRARREEERLPAAKTESARRFGITAEIQARGATSEEERNRIARSLLPSRKGLAWSGALLQDAKARGETLINWLLQNSPQFAAEFGGGQPQQQSGLDPADLQEIINMQQGQ
jgi:hypothetical protein